MIKFVPLYLFLILLSGCNPVTIPPVYDSIELSFSSGWSYAFSLKIDSANIVKKCDYKIISKIESIECFCDTLSPSSVDSLNYFVTKLKISKPDSVYENRGMCQDCPWYMIRVNESGESIESELRGGKHKNLIDSLATFILKRSYSMKNKVDTVYSFPLTNRLLLPVPPFQGETKFTLPVEVVKKYYSNY